MASITVFVLYTVVPSVSLKKKIKKEQGAEEDIGERERQRKKGKKRKK
jgi:hypothetical protein